MDTEKPVSANVLGTIGTVLWCVQLIPQIWHNWRHKRTDGLPPVMMLLWAVCRFYHHHHHRQVFVRETDTDTGWLLLGAVPFGVYMILQVCLSCLPSPEARHARARPEHEVITISFFSKLTYPSKFNHKRLACLV